MVFIINYNKKKLLVKGILGIGSWVLGSNEKTNKNFVLSICSVVKTVGTTFSSLTIFSFDLTLYKYG